MAVVGRAWHGNEHYGLTECLVGNLLDQSAHFARAAELAPIVGAAGLLIKCFYQRPATLAEQASQRFPQRAARTSTWSRHSFGNSCGSGLLLKVGRGRFALQTDEERPARIVLSLKDELLQRMEELAHAAPLLRAGRLAQPMQQPTPLRRDNQLDRRDDATQGGFLLVRLRDAVAVHQSTQYPAVGPVDAESYTLQDGVAPPPSPDLTCLWERVSKRPVEEPRL